MFTGLVEGRGIVHEIRSEGAAISLVVHSPEFLADVHVGDSVAINGCCLTAVAINGPLWTFQAGAETLSKTNLGLLSAGSGVNIERSLAANSRLGGHFVLGHIDGTAKVLSIDLDGDWTTLWFRVPERLSLFMVPKGSLAIDGVSLTIVDVERDRFSVALIPHTLETTTLGSLQKGSRVNIETDILGKYVQKMLEAQRDST